MLDIKNPSEIQTQCYYSKLHKAKKITSNFDTDIKSIVNKAGGFPSTFFCSTIILIVVKTI